MASKKLDMKSGTIKIKHRSDGKISRFIQISGGVRLDVPKIFLLDESHHNKPCEYDNSTGPITKIFVEGVQIPIDDGLYERREKEKAQKEKEALLQKEVDRQAKAVERNAPRANTGTSIPQNEAWLFDVKNTKLPKDTKLALKSFEESIDNFSLRLNKCSQFMLDGAKEKPTLLRRERASPRLGTPNTRISHLRRDGTVNYGDLSFPKIAQRQIAIANDVYLDSYNQCFTLESNMALGIGGSSVFETGFTLHHVYGCPYIPATSIKGIVRSWIIVELFGGSEKDAVADKGFCDIFGCTAEVEVIIEGKRSKGKSWYESEKKGDGDRQGTVVFMDAFSTNQPEVKEDIMNPHYPKYYTGTFAPTDFQSPNPINFLTVSNTTFLFVIGAKTFEPILSGIFKGRTPLDVAKEWLNKALTGHGIGAKTAIGYGFMSPS
jgi:CRISPR-associated protein Cmr6